MIISASRRTDIPAFFGDWFYNRIKAGYVLTRNPMNIHQLSRIELNPSVVDCIVFWTKNPKRFIERLPLINNYTYYFQYTITGYGKHLEPNVPDLEDSLYLFKKLSNLIGKKRIIWRYDPIIITNEHNFNYHINHFNFIAEQLSEYTERCVISFVDYYKKTLKNMNNILYSEMHEIQIRQLSNVFNKIGKQYGLNITSCAEEIDLREQGINHGKCIDDKLIEEITGFSLSIGKDKNQRKECGCIASIDIGAYNTCPHGCLYCYANYDMNQVKKNYLQHEKESDLLFGKITEKDIVKERKVYSCKLIQQNLF